MFDTWKLQNQFDKFNDDIYRTEHKRCTNPYRIRTATVKNDTTWYSYENFLRFFSYYEVLFFKYNKRNESIEMDNRQKSHLQKKCLCLNKYKLI